MRATVYQLDAGSEGREAIRRAAACLAEGGLVVFPTETVYGVGANAADPQALARLREVKQRSDGKPFTVHVGSRSAVERFVPDLRGFARRFVDKGLPGPLTLIFQVDDVSTTPIVREKGVEHAAAMYHQGTIGIRYPDDPHAAELLNDAGVPIVAASANPAGGPAPVDASEAIAALGEQVDMILDGGRARYAKASTIVRVADSSYEIVRTGVLDERSIKRMSKMNFLLVCSGNTCRSPMAEGLLRRLLAEKLGCKMEELEDRGYHVESAGTGAYGGAWATPAAVRVLKERGVDISGHRSQPLDMAKVQRADYVFTMTGAQLQAVNGMASGRRGVIERLDNEDVEDPIGADDELYAQTADQIERALRRRLEEITL